VSFSPDGASIVSGSWGKTVKVWSVESGECVFSGKQLDDSWRTVFKDLLNPPLASFDDTQLSGDVATKPRGYIRNTHAVMKDGKSGVLHFFEHRP